MSGPRSYVVGLPVCITVDDDGTVDFEIDDSEAADAMADEADALVPDEVLVDDQRRVERHVFEPAFRDFVRRFGGGYHPDTSGADYYNLPADLSPQVVDFMTERALALGLDPYGIALDVTQQIDAEQRGAADAEPLYGLVVEALTSSLEPADAEVGLSALADLLHAHGAAEGSTGLAAALRTAGLEDLAETLREQLGTEERTST